MAAVPQASTAGAQWVPRAMNLKSKKMIVSVYIPPSVDAPKPVFQPPLALPFRALQYEKNQQADTLHERKSRRDLWEEGVKRSSGKRKRSHISISSDEEDHDGDNVRGSSQVTNQLERALANLDVEVEDGSQDTGRFERVLEYLGDVQDPPATNHPERALANLNEVEVISIRSSPEPSNDDLEQSLKDLLQATSQCNRGPTRDNDVEMDSIHPDSGASSDDLQSSGSEFSAQQPLKDPFQITRYSWSDEEKEVLCVLRRWYANNRLEYEKVFKSYFPNAAASVRTNGATGSYWYQMRRDYLRRKRHHRPWYDVYLDTEFEDGEGTWASVRQKLEKCAEVVGVRLQRREVDSDEHLHDISLSHEKWQRSREKKPPDTPSSLRSETSRSPEPSPLAGRDMTSRNPTLENMLQEIRETYGSRGEEAESEDELNVCQRSPSAISPSYTPIASASSATLPQKRPTPALLYRVYDTASAGVNTPHGFTAGLFTGLGSASIVPPPPPPPPSGSSIDPIVKFFVGHHVWPQEMQRRQTLLSNTSASTTTKSSSPISSQSVPIPSTTTPSSPLISAGDSLIWSLHKALSSHHAGRNPHIAILDAAKLAHGAGLYPAGPIVEELKRAGNLGEMRYKAAAEYMIWGEIKAEAVIRDVEVRPFVAGLDGTAGDLLRLERFDGKSVAKLRAGFIGDGVLVDPYEGAAVARIAAALGVGPESASEAVAQVVLNIVQGWALTPSVSSFEVMGVCFVDGLLEACGQRNRADDDPDSYARLQTAFELGMSRAMEDLRKGKKRCERKPQRNVRRRLFLNGE